MKTIQRCLPVLVPAFVLVLVAWNTPQDPPLGYSDTPVLQDSKWRVHDGKRPQPRIVTPGQGTAPPSDAIVLFDGSDLSKWTGRGGKAGWKVENGYAEVNGTGSITTRDSFGDCQLHVEWRTPDKVKGGGQGRGNSGVFLMNRYEIQVLDSSSNKTYPDGQAGAIYGQTPPLVNASRGPGQWQTYDIIFKAPSFENGKLKSAGTVTVIHNGVLLHHSRKILGPTSHRNLANYKPHGDKAPIQLQDHGNPMRFRNIWIRPLTGYDETQ